MIDQAEIHRKSKSGEVKEREEALGPLRDSFAILPDKAAAWNDLVRLTGDEDSSVRWEAANNGLEMDLKQALEYEADCFEDTLKTADAQEGLKAFLEKGKLEFDVK